MKRTIGILLLGGMIMLSACGNKGNPDVGNTTTDSEIVNELSNTIAPVDASEMAEEWDAEFKMPEGAELIMEYAVEDEGNTIIQRDFIYDDIHYNARVAKSDELKDISGMYYTWTSEDEVEISGCKGRIMRYAEGEDMADVCLWYDSDNKVTYCLTVIGGDLNGFDITEVAGMIM